MKLLEKYRLSLEKESYYFDKGDFKRFDKQRVKTREIFKKMLEEKKNVND